jgi:hypothetical protein
MGKVAYITRCILMDNLHIPSSGSTTEHTHHVCEQCPPYPEFKLMHKINDEHLRHIKFGTKSFAECILKCVISYRVRFRVCQRLHLRMWEPMTSA